MNNDSFFSADWMETQRKYWDSWMAMSRKAMGQEGGSPTAPWESALDHWWQALAPAASKDSKDFMGRMMEQGKAFFKMAENFLPGASGGTTDGWSAYGKTLEDLQKGFLGSLDDNENALHRLSAFWELPYDNWQRMASSLSPVPGDFLRNMPHDSVKENVNRVLSAPGLGYTREEQGQYQDLIRRSMDYQKALQEYLGFYSKIGMKAVDRMRNYMQGVIESGKSIDSARALYDNWVMCCEAAYAEEVSTTEYARIHGHLVNSQMALKHRMSVMVDENLGALNMPTRSELRTLQDRLQETRRESKRLAHDLHLVQRQLAALVGDGPAAVPQAPARLQAQPQAAPRTALIAKAPAAKQPVARKKPVAKPPTTK